MYKRQLQYLGYTVVILLTSSDRSVPIPESLRKKLVYTIQYTGYAIQMLFQSSDVSRPIPDKLVKRLEYVITYTGAVVSTLLQSSDRSTPIPKELFKRLEYTISYAGYVISMLFKSLDRSTAIAERPLTYNIIYCPIVIPKSISESDQGSFLENAVIEFAEQDEWAGQENIAERQFGLRDIGPSTEAMYNEDYEFIFGYDNVVERYIEAAERLMALEYVPLRRFKEYQYSYGLDALYKDFRDAGELYELYGIPHLEDREVINIVDVVRYVYHEDADFGLGIDAIYHESSDSGILDDGKSEVEHYHKDGALLVQNQTIVLVHSDASAGYDYIAKLDNDSATLFSTSYVIVVEKEQPNLIDMVTYRLMTEQDVGVGLDARWKSSKDEASFVEEETISMREKEQARLNDTVEERQFKLKDEAKGYDSDLFDEGHLIDRYGLARLPYHVIPVPYPDAVRIVAQSVLKHVKDLEDCDIREGAVITSRCINAMVMAAVSLAFTIPLLMFSQIEIMKPSDLSFLEFINKMLAEIIEEVKVFQD